MSDFEFGCGTLILIWLVFGTVGVIGWRQDRKIKSRIGRIASRVFSTIAMVFLLMSFTALLGESLLAISNEQPPAATLPKPPDGWWKCNR